MLFFPDHSGYIIFGCVIVPGERDKKNFWKIFKFQGLHAKKLKKRADAPQILNQIFLCVLQSQHTCVIHLSICFLRCRIQKTCYFTVLITSSLLNVEKTGFWGLKMMIFSFFFAFSNTIEIKKIRWYWKPLYFQTNPIKSEK